jgi:hypothetical protein
MDGSQHTITRDANGRFVPIFPSPPSAGEARLFSVTHKSARLRARVGEGKIAA